MLIVVSLLVALLAGWLVLRSQLVARLDQAMAHQGWVPVSHRWHTSRPTRQPVLGRRQVVVRPTTARQHPPAERRSSGQGAGKKSREQTKARSEGDQALSK